MGQEYKSVESKTQTPAILPIRLLSLERTGDSFHFWIGPFGVHLWRHKGSHKTSPINLDWKRDWR